VHAETDNQKRNHGKTERGYQDSAMKFLIPADFFHRSSLVYLVHVGPKMELTVIINM
jgi:hypothetical protein